MSIINTFFKIFGLTLLGFLFYLFTSFAAVISLALTSIKYVDTYL